MNALVILWVTEPTGRSAATDVIAELGLVNTVHVVEDAASALARLAPRGDDVTIRPDLVVIDQARVPALALADAIHAEPMHARLPILWLAGGDDAAVYPRRPGFGALDKPIDAGRFVAAAQAIGLGFGLTRPAPASVLGPAAEQRPDAIALIADGLAHDFNNLLMVIAGNAAVLQLADDPAEIDELAGEIAQAAERAGVLVRQLAMFGRRRIAQSQPLDLRGVISDFTRRVQNLAGDTIQVVIESAQQLPLALADVCKFEEVLFNLTLCARNAMPRGGTLTFALSAHELDAASAQALGAPRAGRYVALTLRGSGECLEILGGDLWDLPSEFVGRHRGLASVRAIALDHHGFVDAHDEPGQGRAVRVFLPAAPG